LNKKQTQASTLPRGIGPQIIQLGKEGLSYREISRTVPCSISTVNYHLAEGGKQKCHARRALRREKNTLATKIENFFGTTRRMKFNSEIKRFSVEDFIKKFGKNPKCYLTGQSIDLNNKHTYSLDHITPLSKGGGCSLKNCAPVIAEANRMKGALALKDFKKICKQVTKNFK
jgi:CRISPR/Cas system Type II protein with McrA/HNH and RuvC-like nuclease domain